MCKEFIEFELKEGGTIVQSQSQIMRIIEKDDYYLLKLTDPGNRIYSLSKSKKNLKAIRSLTEKHKCCKEN